MIVRTPSGLVEGRFDGTVASFLGVPYAAPPFGEHRFRAPVPPPAWDGVRPALLPGAAAPQPAGDDVGLYAPEVFVTGEDCLNLDVHVPGTGATGLPVLVWFHGGAFAIGGNGAAWHRGHRFARDGVVCVAVNYRLGFEGFLALEGAPLNRGVLDWLAALEWVRSAIAAFGGDPGNVTIAGQSAGGAACATLLTMPRAAGLFRRAIVMSGSASLAVPEEEARAHAAGLAARLGVRPRAEDFAAIPPAALVAGQPPPMAAGASGTLGGTVPIQPVVDGDLVPRVPLDALRAGAGGHLPLLVGCTSDEAGVFVRAMAGGIDEATAATVLAHMGLPPGYRDAHPGLSPGDLVGRAAGDHLFRRETIWIEEARAATAAAPTHAYEFRWESPVPSPLGIGVVGAAHNIDLPFAFDLLDAPGVERTAGKEPPRALAGAMHGAWVRFARDGDPGWPPYERARRQVMVFDAASGVADDPLRTQRRLLHEA
ncbi:carboxylesterase/lipase family protein [Streptosporangium vulgare]|uniref:Carboxylic ester hydrolase n=1 Tax=Streptosporangium vulgare TaxID=46190 RepID=A0ABV5TPT9_9ACTN